MMELWRLLSSKIEFDLCLRKGGPIDWSDSGRNPSRSLYIVDFPNNTSVKKI